MWGVRSRPGQYVVALDIASSDGGNTFTGLMKYAAEDGCRVNFVCALFGLKRRDVLNRL